ncbi:MAG: exodeoxyribonuclease VII small subunit [Acidobacteria bacterium]|jgi:exodeoxyribonuclease VII small subunit|nr:exodeoxyribonuclease VII small subunit [Acidobacteriota bacterium]
MSIQTFEESIAQLEKIVAQLQSGELPLDRALELFEQGVRLSRQCQSQLEQAERKVEILLQEKGELRTASFESGRDSVGVAKVDGGAASGYKKDDNHDEENDEDDEDDEDSEDDDDGLPF